MPRQLVSLEAREMLKDGKTVYVVMTRNGTEDGQVLSTHKSRKEARGEVVRLSKALEMPLYDRRKAERYADEQVRLRAEAHDRRDKAIKQFADTERAEGESKRVEKKEHKRREETHLFGRELRSLLGDPDSDYSTD
jgi:hypothetical protein